MVVTERNGQRGLVFDIKRFAVHDGPGVRTAVFLKGCSLRCVWCHNPEGLDRTPEIFFYVQKCTRCGACIEVCPHGAQRLVDDQRIFDRSLCDLCGDCLDVCYTGALAPAGKWMTVEEVMAVVREDAPFYQASGGGVTLSGGEPLVQPEFAIEVLRACKAEGLRTAVDTCGQVGWKVMQSALPHVDLWLYDLKHVRDDQHRRYTGATNRRVIENLQRLGRSGAAIEIRMPIVPTVNDSQQDIEAAASLLASIGGIRAVRLLPYHRLAGSKYEALGKRSTLPAVASPSRAQMRRIRDWMRAHGLNVVAPEPIAGAWRRKRREALSHVSGNAKETED